MEVSSIISQLSNYCTFEAYGARGQIKIGHRVWEVQQGLNGPAIKVVSVHELENKVVVVSVVLDESAVELSADLVKTAELVFYLLVLGLPVPS